MSKKSSGASSLGIHTAQLSQNSVKRFDGDEVCVKSDNLKSQYEIASMTLRTPETLKVGSVT